METQEQIKNLVENLETLKKAIADRNQEWAVEVVTSFLLQFIEVFGHDKEIVQAIFPTLERLKNLITAADYDTAFVHVHALLWRFREVRFRIAG